MLRIYEGEAMEFGAGVFDELDNRYQLLTQDLELVPRAVKNVHYGLP